MFCLQYWGVVKWVVNTISVISRKIDQEQSYNGPPL